MPYIAPEIIMEAKRMDLLTYLKNYEPHELVRFAGNTYTTRTHDSLKISNGKWMWWSQGIGGKSALDYLVKVKGLSFLEAVETIMGSIATNLAICQTTKNRTLLDCIIFSEKICIRSISYLHKSGCSVEKTSQLLSNYFYISQRLWEKSKHLLPTEHISETKYEK